MPNFPQPVLPFFPEPAIEVPPTPPAAPAADAQAGNPGAGPSGTTIQPPFTEMSKSHYWEAGVSITTIWDKGLGFAPLAGPAGAMCVFWRMRGVSAMRVATWVVATLNRVPNPPHWDLSDANSVEIGRVMSVAMPTDFPDGNSMYYMVGQYVWALQKAPSDTDVIQIPASILRPGSGKILNPAEFTKYLLGPITPPAGFAGQAVAF